MSATARVVVSWSSTAGLVAGASAVNAVPRTMATHNGRFLNRRGRAGVFVFTNGVSTGGRFVLTVLYGQPTAKISPTFLLRSCRLGLPDCKFDPVPELFDRFATVRRQFSAGVQGTDDESRQAADVRFQAGHLSAQPLGELQRCFLRPSPQVSLLGPGLQRVEAVTDEFIRRPACGVAILEGVGKLGKRRPGAARRRVCLAFRPVVVRPAPAGE